MIIAKEKRKRVHAQQIRDECPLRAVDTGMIYTVQNDLVRPFVLVGSDSFF